MLLCFHWDVFNNYIQMLSDNALILFYRSKMARKLNYMNGKT